MRAFMDKDFLLGSETARHLYHDYAEDMPVIDYHCHLDPREIYEDRQFENMTQVWLGGDHYKWRLMRSAGVPEWFITGGAADREKFQKWAETVGLAIGSPLYHWSHLELRRYFGYDGVLNGDTAGEVWQLCNDSLKRPDMSARNLILRSNVAVICTTDDPADSLEWHKKLAGDESFPVRVLPSFRPDRALGIDKEDYCEYIERLGASAGIDIGDYDRLVRALESRLAYFAENGCRVSDHGMEAVPFAPASKDEAAEVFSRRLAGEIPSAADEKRFRTALLLELGRVYSKLDMVMQLHFGVIRDNSKRIFRMLGPDAGIDSIGDQIPVKELAGFLNALDETGELPKTVLYSLNPNDNTAIETVMGCFQSAGYSGDSDGALSGISRIQHGMAWWFNDHRKGMTDHMVSLANEGFLAGSVGMLTDSRSFLSYARHEYFRRILCGLVGEWVDNGEFANDEKALAKIIKGICYSNAERYFGFQAG